MLSLLKNLKKSDAKIIILLAILFAIITPIFVSVNDFKKVEAPLASLIQVLLCVAILIFSLAFKAKIRSEFNRFYYCFIITISAFIVLLLYSYFSPSNYIHKYQYILTEGNAINYLPYSVLCYIIAFGTFVSMCILSSARVSRDTKIDTYFTMFIVLLLFFSFVVRLVNIFNFTFYHKLISIEQTELLYPMVYLTCLFVYLDKKYFKRVLLYGTSYKYYFTGVTICTVWSIINSVNMLVKYFWVPTLFINNIYLLGISFMFYGVINITTKTDKIEYIEYPKLTRSFVIYFSFLVTASLSLLFIKVSVSKFYIIAMICAFILLTIRLLFLKGSEQYALNLILKKQQELYKAANFDFLTDLPNRRKLLETMNQLIENQKPFTLILIDIDNFHHINNLFKYQSSDSILIELSRRLLSIIETQFQGVELKDLHRTYGDEYILVIELSGNTKIEELCKEILNMVSIPFEIKSETIQIKASASAASFPKDADTVDGLLQAVNVSLVLAKKDIENKYCIFKEEIFDKIKNQLVLERELNFAISRNEFELFYQPQYTADKKLVGFEALIRWNHPEKGLVSPDNFIHLAEESGLIVPIGEWVFFEACRQLKEWMTLTDIPLKMSINVSTRQLQQSNFNEKVKNILDTLEIDPTNIKIEITETYPFYENETIVSLIEDFHKMGFKISIDDFGTGYCSLTSLTKVAIDQIKISREYVNSIGTESKDAILLTHTLGICQGLDFETIAEGVETKEQLEDLKKLGCNLIQGYYFSRPLNKEKAESVILESTKQV